MNAVVIETPKDAARRVAASCIRDGFKPEALHEYRDAQGNPVFWRIRCKRPSDGDKWIRPMRWDGAVYVIGEPPAPDAGKPLYRLPELLATNPDAVVWIVEGEACADALAKLDLTATTSGSADSADAADWTPLQGRRMRIWPDHDKAGAGYADKVESRLRALGCAVERVDVDTLDLPAKGDCVDWLKSHPDADAVDVLSLPLAEEMPAESPAGRSAPNRCAGPRPRLSRTRWNRWAKSCGRRPKQSSASSKRRMPSSAVRCWRRHRWRCKDRPMFKLTAGFIRCRCGC